MKWTLTHAHTHSVSFTPLDSALMFQTLSELSVIGWDWQYRVLWLAETAEIRDMMSLFLLSVLLMRSRFSSFSDSSRVIQQVSFMLEASEPSEPFRSTPTPLATDFIQTGFNIIHILGNHQRKPVMQFIFSEQSCEMCLKCVTNLMSACFSLNALWAKTQQNQTWDTRTETACFRLLQLTDISLSTNLFLDSCVHSYKWRLKVCFCPTTKHLSAPLKVNVGSFEDLLRTLM